MSCMVRLWDRNFDTPRIVSQGWRMDEPGVLTVPANDPDAQWLLGMSSDAQAWLTADTDGQRYIGRLDNYEVVRAPFADGGTVKYLRAEFVNDHLVHRWMTDICRMIPPNAEELE